jgi:diguanylate cyclase
MIIHNRKIDEFINEWNELADETPLDVRQCVGKLVQQHAIELADLFYNNLLADAEAKSFIDHKLVSQRLHASLRNWLIELFPLEQNNSEEIFQHQRHIGVAHARLQIPVTLVLRGARMLKHRIYLYLVASDLERSDLIKAINFVSETMELAMDVMTDAFVIDHEKHAREDESYRMFALGSNMLAERERQRAALVEWAQHILLSLLAEPGDREWHGIVHSEFGLWLEHKASIVFKAAPELEQIKKRITEIEASVSPKMQLARKNTLDARQLMKEIEACIAEIKFLLGGLFDRFIEVESGRDSLTRLLNRRHLPSVLTREVTLSRKTGVPFTLLMLDIDHYKNNNDSFGHDAGDMVLQQAADMIASCVRAGDFVFRVGGEEFLILLVEIDKVAALKVAEAIRKRVAIEPFRIGDAKNTNVTVSIGIATYNGHPDYQVAIKNADEALFEAKNTGRNRCAISGN